VTKTKDIAISTEKKITPNGGLSKDLGDVVKRMATSSGDWETTEP